MVIWKGLGILVPVQVFIVLILFQAAADAIWGQGFYSDNDRARQVAMIAASISLFPVGLWLNRDRAIADSAGISEPPPSEPARHTFFFIPYQHWMWGGLGLLVLVETAA